MFLAIKLKNNNYLSYFDLNNCSYIYKYCYKCSKANKCISNKIGHSMPNWLKPLSLLTNKFRFVFHQFLHLQYIKFQFLLQLHTNAFVYLKNSAMEEKMKMIVIVILWFFLTNAVYMNNKHPLQSKNPLLDEYQYNNNKLPWCN